MQEISPDSNPQFAVRNVEEVQHSPFLVFDILRAVAAFAVVISHIRSMAIADYDGGGLVAKLFYAVTGVGHQAVMVFFVISGYWITGSVAKRVAQDRWLWRGYFLDRLSRLWVVLVPALFLGLLFDWGGGALLRLPIYVDNQHGMAVIPGILAHLGISDFLINLFFLQTLMGPVFGSNGPLWSLANEFWYYIWFPAIYIPLLRPRRLSSWAGLTPAVSTMFIFSHLIPGFLVWLMGSALYFLVANRPARPSRRSFIIWLCSLLSLVAWLMVTRFFSFPLAVEDAFSGLATAAFLYATLSASIRPVSLLAPLARFGSRCSYSLYVTHFPFCIFVIGLICYNARFPFNFYSFLMVSVIFLATIIYSSIFSFFTEQNTSYVRNWIERLLLRCGVTVRVVNNTDEPTARG